MKTVISFPKSKRRVVNIYDYFELVDTVGWKYGLLDALDEAYLSALRGYNLVDLWINESTIKMPIPVQTICIGEPIKISQLYGTAEFKTYKKSSPRLQLNAGEFFIFRPMSATKFSLYEYPVDLAIAPIKPKSDVFLYLIGTDIIDLEKEVARIRGFKLVRKFKSIDAVDLLKKRFLAFQLNPTATNTVLVFQIMDAILMDKAKEGKLDSFLEGPGEKRLDKFEKIKNLALGTQHHQEREVAVTRCYESFLKLIEE